MARPAVLIEHPDETAGLALASSLRQAGYAVAICPGPEQADRCPLTGPQGCAAAHGADAVVSSLGLEQPQARLFAGASNVSLRLLDSTTTSTGVVVLTYAKDDASPQSPGRNFTAPSTTEQPRRSTHCLS